MRVSFKTNIQVLIKHLYLAFTKEKNQSKALIQIDKFLVQNDKLTKANEIFNTRFPVNFFIRKNLMEMFKMETEIIIESMHCQFVCKYY